MRRLLLLLVGWAVLAMASARDFQLIPQPLSVRQMAGADFRLAPNTPIAFAPQLEAQAIYLRDLVRRSTGFNLPLRRGGKSGIVLAISPAVTQPEGYRLQVRASGVRIEGHDVAGVFNGLQTLLQLLPPDIYAPHVAGRTAWTAPAVDIADHPNRPWRGMMLDVARYFFEVDFVKRYIDLMAYYKLNKLQLHLIDDSGWRLEIKRYPRLTEVGAWAGSPDQRVGGYYTQAEMRDLIAYAAARNVEIIPEIEFPAHLLSAIVAYPHLSCTGEQHELPLRHFISRDLLCVGRPASLEFLEHVLDEVVALFPSPIIHIGGDEAVYDRWAACPHCKALMAREGLTEAAQLQGWLTNHVAQLMARRQRTVMGWEEIIMRGAVEQSVVALIWHNVADSIYATQGRHKAVLAPATHLYFDFPEAKHPGEVEAAKWMPPISLEQVYGMPINDYSPQGTVLGAQGCLWSDLFLHSSRLRDLSPLADNRSTRYVEYLTLPRLMALSEICWLPNARRNWPDFAARNAYNYARLEAMNYHYRLPQPIVTAREDHGAFGATFTLASPIEGCPIVYTTDGTAPHRHSSRYVGPVRVDDKEAFRAALLHTTARGTRLSLPYRLEPDFSAFAQLGSLVARNRQQPTADVAAVEERYDLSGLIQKNGTYTLHCLEQLAQQPFAIERIEVWKRDECIATLLAPNAPAPATAAPISLRAGQQHAFAFAVSNFEAGTPFSLRVVRSLHAEPQQFLLFLSQP